MNNDFVREVCLALPATTEDIKWEHDLCFSVGNKMYCVAGTADKFGVSFKCSDEDFAMLLERDGIIPAPYLARNKWLMVEKPNALNKQEWKDYIKKSYILVAAKLKKEEPQLLKGLRSYPK
jgi:predicted DNA-binding protein (MmcQ/YjbR family)